VNVALEVLLTSIAALLTTIDADTSRIIANAATEAKQDDQETTLNALEALLAEQGGMNINEWLEDIEADVDGIEDRLDTLIAANAANFGLNIAEMGIQTALNIAAIVANAGAVVAGIVFQTGSLNGSLQDIENIVATEATLGSINTSLNNIESDTGNMDTSLNNIESDIDVVRLQGVRGQGNVVSTTIPAANTDLEARPAANEEGFIKGINVTNNHGIFPVSFLFYDYNGTNQFRFHSELSIPAGVNVDVVINRRFQRDNYLRIIAGSLAAHTYVVSFVDEPGADNTFTFTSPT